MSGSHHGRIPGGWRADPQHPHSAFPVARIANSSTETSSSDRAASSFIARHDRGSHFASPPMPHAPAGISSRSQHASIGSFYFREAVASSSEPGDIRHSQPVEHTISSRDADSSVRYHRRSSSSFLESPESSATDSPAVRQTTDQLGNSLPSSLTSSRPAETGGGTKKRSRIQQACKSCSTRRVKCDGRHPCQTCVKNGDQCVYGKPKKRGPPKGTSRSARRSAPGAPSFSQTEEVKHANRPRHGPYAGSMQWQRQGAPGRDEDRVLIRDTSVRHHLRPEHLLSNAEPHSERNSADARPPYASEEEQSGRVLPPPALYFTDEGRPLKSPGGATRPWFELRNMGSPHLSEDSRQRRTGRQSSQSQERNTRAADQRDESLLSWEEKSAGQSAARPFEQHPREFYGVDIADFTLAQLHGECRRARSRAEDRCSPPSLMRMESGQDVNLDDPQISGDVIDRLFEEYCNGINVQWPMFPRRMFPTPRSLREHCESCAPLLSNAICSISAAFFDTSRDGVPLAGEGYGTLTAQQISDIFYVRAYYYHIRALMTPSLEAAAALLLLSLRENGAGRATHASHFMWLAGRMVCELGLQRFLGVARQGASSSPQVEEMRRRIFWCAYNNDKNIAVQHGRPVILRAVETSCPFPTFCDADEASFCLQHKTQLHAIEGRADERHHREMPKLSAFFLRSCRLAHIAEGIIGLHTEDKNMESVFSTRRNASVTGSQVVALATQLEEWERSAPALSRLHHGTTAATSPSNFAEHIWGQTLKLLLHRPFILTPAEGSAGLQSHAEATRAAEKIFALFSDFEKGYPLRKIPTSLVYCLFTAATILVGNLTSTEPAVAGKARMQLQLVAQWIRTIAATWTIAWRHLSILEQLAASMGVDLYDTDIAGATVAVAEAARAPESSAGSSSDTLPAPSLSGFTHSDSASSLPAHGRPPPVLAPVNSVPGDGDMEESRLDPSDAAQPTPYPFGAQKQSQPHGLSLSAWPSHGMPGPSNEVYTGMVADRPYTYQDDQAIAAFWSDMPLGEDINCWRSFTRVYWSLLSRSTSDEATRVDRDFKPDVLRSWSQQQQSPTPSSTSRAPASHGGPLPGQAAPTGLAGPYIPHTDQRRS